MVKGASYGGPDDAFAFRLVRAICTIKRDRQRRDRPAATPWMPEVIELGFLGPLPCAGDDFLQ